MAQRTNAPSSTPYASIIWFRFKGCFSARSCERPSPFHMSLSDPWHVKALLNKGEGEWLTEGGGRLWRVAAIRLVWAS